MSARVTTARTANGTQEAATPVGPRAGAELIAARPMVPVRPAGLTGMTIRQTLRTDGPVFLPAPSRTASAFTAANWAALRRIKAAHGPDNIFGAGLAVPPAAVTASA